MENKKSAMATITYWSADFEPLAKPLQGSNLLKWVKQAEKRIFPRNEILDFDVELKKHNTELTLVLEGDSPSNPTALIAYAVFARHKRTSLLHKVCVLEKHRRRGIARAMLEMQKKKLRRHGGEAIKLWVDEAREPARRLYAGVGFQEVDRLEDYYAPRRTGIQMMLSLLPT